MKRFFLFTVYLMTPLYALSAHAGAWLQPEDHGLFIAQKSFFQSSHYFDAHGNQQKQPSFTKWETQPYVEYGLTKTITIGGTFFVQSDEQSGHQKLGLADPQIFSRAIIWKSGSQLVSLQPLIKFPSAFRNKTTPRGGTSSHDAELSALYGRNLNIITPRDYLDINTGYRLRNGALHNQYHADAALGLQINPNWQIIPAIRTVFAADMSTQRFSQTGDLDKDLIKFELAATYKWNDNRTLNMIVFNNVWGRQTGDGYGASIGFSQTF